ncbi:MAG: Trk system potassium transporter TrkA [Lachnospiraceae bacterium]|nr:Trk system potassium transporter TrkA [Lachnospiraceae bacterium]
MKIIIVGCGKVGYALAELLSAEGHDITAIDQRADKLSIVSGAFDLIGINGNGTSFETLKEAGIATADLLIAVTGSDEHNLLCCMVAKKTGNCKTIARVRNPIYHNEIEFLRNEFGIASIINPDAAAAQEISQIVRFPFALKVDTFAKGHIHLVHFRVESDSVLAGLTLQEIRYQFKHPMLVCTVARGKEIFIPKGNFKIEAGDVIGVVAERGKMNTYFKQLSLSTSKAKNVMILGGGNTAYYLAKMLLKIGVNIKIIEESKTRCEQLCEELPQATIICGDATDEGLLIQEGLKEAEALVALLDMDEENILVSLYSHSVSSATTITRVNRVNFNDIVNAMNLDSILYPRLITADHITKFVRSEKGSMNNDVESFYSLADGQAEVLEFSIKEESDITGISLFKLPIKPNTLISCIYRKGKVIIPTGQDSILPGDTVVVVLKDYKISSITEILER